MKRLAVIKTIDISKQAQTLAWLRLTDYALVILCGSSAAGLLSDSVINFMSNDAGTLAFQLILSLTFCFAAYTGWRHVGKIDPAVWRVHSILFPVLAVVCLMLAGISIVEVGSLAVLFDSDQATIAGVLNFFYIGCVAILGWISLMMVQRRNITAMGASVDQILLQLSKKAGVAAKEATKIKRINIPRGLVVGATGLLILSAVILAPIPDDKDLARTIVKIFHQGALLGFFLLLRARRYFQIDADSLLAVDRRPPILFLRSFDDDEKQKFTTADKALLDFSLETRLSNHFSRFGPFIAIGSPKEAVPQLGAARALLSDEEWQPRVLGWMREAGLIIMYSGKTHWVNWELRQVVENKCATRLILMFPEIKAWSRSKRNDEISARVEQIRQVFKNTPWEEELLEFSDFPGLRAMLFRPDGSMIMVKSQSRSRESYHLAALIAHQNLLEPDNFDLGAYAEKQVPRHRRSLAAIGALAATVIAVLGAVYLFPNSDDHHLMFKQGEIRFSEPVTEDEARRVGESLVRQQYFSDEKEATVQLLMEQGQYLLRFVINPKYADNPRTAILFGIIGSQVATDALGGKPLELGFTDNQLKLIRVVPLSTLKMFRKGELYYTEPVTEDEARRVGESLVRQQYFSDEKETTVQLSKEQGQYLLRFVVNPEYADEPLMAMQCGIIGSQVATDALGGKPLELSFTDNQLKLIRVVPLSTLKMFGKGELCYTEHVTEDEARRVGEFLVRQQYFSDERQTTMQLHKEQGQYLLRFVINSSYKDDPEIKALFKKLSRDIATNALGGRPVVLHLCDEYLRTLQREQLLTKVE